MLFDHVPASAWITFHVIVFVLLALDLGVFNRKAHVISIKEAMGWSLFWIALGLGFALYVEKILGHAAAIEYVTGYLVEKSLSIDNLFVFAVIFKAFKIEGKYQHRLLFWGIIGALIFRGIMIYAGAELLLRFHWLIYVFGIFLFWTGIKFLKGGAEEIDPKKNPLLSFLHRFFKFSTEPHGGRFFVRNKEGFHFTDLFAVLLIIESTDVVFALDSIPAVFGITRDPFIVYTSNVFAILGLRALFFVLEDLLDRFHYLKTSLALVLMYVGAKMCSEYWVKVPAWVNLIVIGVLLIGGVVASLAFPAKETSASAKAQELNADLDKKS